tara:strand:+ start:12079 stop:12300 length:222 start_codon:yes stop_codon:yes gene_type:complete
MSSRLFKLLIVGLLSIIVIIYYYSIDVGRYELNKSDGFIFDTKTGKIYSVKGGILDLIEIAKEKELQITKDSI